MALTVLTGASGLLGANLAAILVEQGHRVRATRRGSTRIDHLADLPIEWVEADLGQPEQLAGAFRGADVVFHCAAQVGVRRGVSPEMERTNVGGTASVLAAVRAAGVPRLVHTSSVVAIGLSDDGQPCTEESRWNFEEHRLLDGYAITKRRAEELVTAAAGQDVDAVIVNPTYMFGPRDARPSSGHLIIDLVKRKVPGWTPGLNDFVDVRDVARSMIAAWQRGRRGERYILGGERASYEAMMKRICEVAGVRPPRWSVPRPLAAVMGRVGDLSERLLDREPLVTSTTVRYAFSDRFIFSSDRAIRELGHRAGPIEVAIRDAITWFRAHGMLPEA